MAERRYLHYSVIQYVHSRREERLNVGVAVYDPVEGRLVPAFNPEAAAGRIKALYPDVDSIGIQHYLAGLVRSLPRDERVVAALRGNESPLEALIVAKQNMFQLTPTRLYGAVSAGVAAKELVRKYVDPQERATASRRVASVRWARRVTEDAIEAVLGKFQGVHYSSEDWIYGGGRFKYRIRFPIYLPDQQAAIDAISLAGSGVKAPEAEADHFIKKASNLAKVTDDVLPYVTAAVDSRNPELGRELIKYIRDELHWDETRIAEANAADVSRMVGAIAARAA